MPQTVPTKPYDWTYTTTYAGHLSSHNETASPIHSSRLLKPTIPWVPADQMNPSHSIPMAELMRPDPILFYAEIPLFEDELHDNGSSNLLVRIVCSSLSRLPLSLTVYISFGLDVARNANLHIYSIPVHITCGQCCISHSRYTDISFARVDPTVSGTPNKRLGSSI